MSNPQEIPGWFGRMLAGIAAVGNLELSPPLVLTWWAALRDIPREQLERGAQRWVMLDGQWPSPAKLRAQALEADQLDAGAAFDQLMEAVRVYGYYAKADGLARLDPLTRRALQAVGGWSVACDCPIDQRGTFRAHFLKCYAAAATCENERRLLPPALHKRIEGAVDGN